MNFSFCKGVGEFLDVGVAWESNRPVIGYCAERSLFALLPDVVFWTFLPLELFRRPFIVQAVPVQGCLSFSRLILLCLLWISLLAEFLYYLSRWLMFGGNVPFLIAAVPFLQFLTFAVMFLLQIWHYKRNVFSSALCWCVMLLHVMLGIFEVYSLTYGILEDTNSRNIDYVHFGLYCFQYLLFVALFAAFSFALNVAPESAQLLLPENVSQRKACPEPYCSFPNRILFHWFHSIVQLGYRSTLSLSDLYFVNVEERTDYVGQRFRTILHREFGEPNRDGSAKRSEPSLLKVVIHFCGWSTLATGVLKLSRDMLILCGPLLLKWFIQYTSDLTQPVWHGYVLAVLLVLWSILTGALLEQYNYSCSKIGIRIEAAIISTIYQKAVDASRFVDVCTNIHSLWSSPLQVVIALFLLYQTVGVAAFIGFAVMFLFVPSNVIACSLANRYQTKQMSAKDQRIRLMNEMLCGIKVVKLNAWEPAFERRIDAIRENELSVLQKGQFATLAVELSFKCGSLLVSIVTFVSYVLLGHDLTPDTAFVAFAFFKIMEFPLGFMPLIISNFVQLLVSAKRLRLFLATDELRTTNSFTQGDDDVAISVRHGSFAWNGTQMQPSLPSVNVNFFKGQLVMVVGPVAAGKSNLLSAICSEMRLQAGRISVKGNIAYCPQQAWIQNMSIRDNISFSRPYLEQHYNRVVDACGLRPDLDLLPAGDLTQIGSRGINLSGGQKQRIALARAVYQDCDTYLFDDTLSAVDVHVGRHVFDNVIGPTGCLNDKTRVFVTHQLRYLASADYVILMQDGRITECGSYEELSTRKGAFVEYMRVLKKEQDKESIHEDETRSLATAISTSPPTKESLSSISDGSLSSLQRMRSCSASSSSSIEQFLECLSPIETCQPAGIAQQKLLNAEDEEIYTGKIPFWVYWTYIKAAGWLRAVQLCLSLVACTFLVLSGIWLAKWTDNSNSSTGARINATQLSTSLAIEVYAGLGGAVLVFAFVANWVATFTVVRAARSIHHSLLTSLMRVPMLFYDKVPIGRVLNRCSKDMDAVDSRIPSDLAQVLSTGLLIGAVITNVIYAIPMFSVAVVPMLFVYWLILSYYVCTSRQLRRLEAISRSPLYAFFSESLDGVASIRIYQQQERFAKRCDRLIDENNCAKFAMFTANRWLAMRLTLLGCFLIAAAAGFTIYGRQSGLSAGLVGLCMSYVLLMTDIFAFSVKFFSELETEMVSLERIQEYISLQPEPGWISSENSVAANWPERGDVDFQHYSVRYRPELDYALYDVTCQVAAGQRIGIVGRTGAGKSSLMLGLLRLINASEGRILVDGIDIATVGSRELRDRLSVIPQDAVVFSGTVRFNLDPLGKHSDAELWRALEVSCLKEYVAVLPAQLDEEIFEGGANLSAGQRQLLCLGRVSLKKSRILVLDEATAAVDPQTDLLIQAALRSSFKPCTMLIIAHRLETIMDSDKILVLKQGHIAEYASPSELLNDASSIFFRMVMESRLQASR